MSSQLFFRIAVAAEQCVLPFEAHFEFSIVKSFSETSVSAVHLRQYQQILSHM